MRFSVDPTLASPGSTSNTVPAAAVRSTCVDARYLDVVPAIPTDNCGVPLNGVSMITLTRRQTALAGNVNMDLGDVSPKAMVVVSTTTLSVPAAMVVHCRVTTFAENVATVKAWLGEGSPEGITTVRSWVMPVLGRRRVYFQLAPLELACSFSTTSSPVIAARNMRICT